MTLLYQRGDKVTVRHESVPGVVLDAWKDGDLAFYDVDVSGIRKTVSEEDIVRRAVDEPLIARLVAGDFGDSYDFELQFNAYRLMLANKYDQNASLNNSRLEIQDHQVFVAHRVVQEAIPRFVLADEVGLGKTIEAGLVVKELRARGLVRRVLILVPSGLVGQWQVELDRKFHETFIIYRSETERVLRDKSPFDNPWLQENLVIASTKFATYKPERMVDIVSAGWDLVIIDEAHHARKRLESSGDNTTTNLYRLADQLKDACRGLLLLTATPMQIDDSELYYLTQLVRPWEFPSLQAFRGHLEKRRQINESIGQLRRLSQLNQFDRIILEHRVRQQLQELNCMAPASGVFQGAPADVEVNRMVGDLQRYHDPLADMMIRNRKKALGVNVKRVPRIQPIQLSPEEREIYDLVSGYVRSEYRRSQQERDQARGFLMLVFQKLLTSSSFALRAAVQRRITKVLGDASSVTLIGDEDDEEEAELSDRLGRYLTLNSKESRGELGFLQEVLGKLGNITLDSKAEALTTELHRIWEHDPSEKVLIFTQFIETQEYLRRILIHKYDVQVFNGRMSQEQKDQAVKAFRESGQILIATESGSEGRNFQFCHILINYDLPWNPIKVEQRIGRLDRIGQKRDVVIFNFKTTDTIEERVVDVLHNRIRIFEEAVGSLDPILESLESEIEELILTGTDAGFTSYSQNLEARIRSAREAEEKLADFLMDQRSFRKDKTSELLGHKPSQTWNDLLAFASDFLRRYEAAQAKSAGPIIDRQPDGTMWIHPPAAFCARHAGIRYSDGFHGAFEVEKALADESLNFFAFGHPLIEAMIDECISDEFPGCCCYRRVRLGDRQPQRAAQFNFVLEFAGVRPKEEVFPVVLDWISGEYDPELSQIIASTRALPGVQPVVFADAKEQLVWLWQRAKTRAAQETQRRRSQLQEQNQELYEAEVRRWDSLFDHRKAVKEGDRARLKRRISEVEREGSPGERRILPAWYGQLRDLERELERVAAEREERVRELQEKQTISMKQRLVSVALVETVQ